MWLPSLHAAEIRHGIPTNLLARLAFEESSFRSAVINGTVRSPVGAIGLMQLMPEFFKNAGRSTLDDIESAAELLANLYHRFHDWQTAVAAYNCGGGYMDEVLKGEKTMPVETRNYVAQIFADVPVPSSLSQTFNV